MLEVRGLTKRFGTKVAVDNLSLQVRPGEVFGFLGPNGAGKTTTIKVCAGLLRPTAGEVIVAGRSILAQPVEAKRVIGYVPESPFLYDQLTGREFLEFVAEVYLPEAGAGRAARVAECLSAVGLTEQAGSLIETYSQGMRRRLVLGAALVHRPRVLLLDEPTAGLDPFGARDAKLLLAEAAAGGAAVLLTTHVLEIAERLCQRVGIIHHGRLVAAGTIDELRRRVEGEPDSTLEEVFMAITRGAVEGVPAETETADGAGEARGGQPR